MGGIRSRRFPQDFLWDSSLPSAAQPRQDECEFFLEGIGVRSLAFPNGLDTPPEGCESGCLLGVPFDIAREFRRPITGITGRLAAILAGRVLVPEAAMDLDGQAMPWQDDIRLAGQVFPVQAESVAHGVERAPDTDLRLGIGLLHAPHDLAALFRGNEIGHGDIRTPNRTFRKREAENSIL